MQELQTAFGQYIERWHRKLVPTTPAMNEYVARPYIESVAWAPGRMVDRAEEMLGAWRRNDNTGKTSGALLPVVLVALAKDYYPVGGDHGRQVSQQEYVMLPTDPKERIFKLQMIQGARRGQILIAAEEEATARSIANQMILFFNDIPNRRFYASYTFAGIADTWPITLETNDIPALTVDSEGKNLTLLALDFHLMETIPFLRGPTGDEPNDGKGSGTPEDPNGYPGVDAIRVFDKNNGFVGEVSVKGGTQIGDNAPPPPPAPIPDDD